MNSLNREKTIIGTRAVKGTRMQMLILTLILFSSTVLYTETNTKYYILIVLGICCLSVFRIIFKPRIITLVINCGYFWWVTLFFSFIFLLTSLLPIYEYGYEFNGDYRFFIWVVILNIIVWFIDIEPSEANRVLINSGIMVSLFAIGYVVVTEAASIIQGGIRIGDSVSGNVNSFSINIGYYFVLTLYRLMFERKKRLLPVVVVQIAAMMLTGSKTGIMIIVATLGIMYLFKYGIRFRRYISLIIGIWALVYIIITNNYLFNIIGYRVVDFLGQLGFGLFGGGSSHSTAVRVENLKYGMKLILSSSLIGHGWGSFIAHSPTGYSSHNNAIELFVSYGFSGFLFYYGMYAKLIRSAYLRMKNDHFIKLFFTFLIVELLIEFVYVNFFLSPIHYIFFFFVFINTSKRHLKKFSLEVNSKGNSS